MHIEVLDPTTNQCFGNPFSRFFIPQWGFSFKQAVILILQVYSWKLSWIWWCSDVFDQVPRREGRQQGLLKECGHWCTVSLCQVLILAFFTISCREFCAEFKRLRMDDKKTLEIFICSAVGPPQLHMWQQQWSWSSSPYLSPCSSGYLLRHPMFKILALLQPALFSDILNIKSLCSLLTCCRYNIHCWNIFYS